MLRGLAVVAVGVFLLVTTAARVQDWTDETRLWRSATRTAPLKPRPWVNYGKQLALGGDPQGAELAYRHAMALAQIRTDEREQRLTFLSAGINTTLALMDQGRVADAWWTIGCLRYKFPTSPYVLEVFEWVHRRYPVPYVVYPCGW